MDTVSCFAQEIIDSDILIFLLKRVLSSGLIVGVSTFIKNEEYP